MSLMHATPTENDARLAHEVRAELARQGVTLVQLSKAVGRGERWSQRRLGRRPTVPISWADLCLIAAHLGVSPSELTRRAEGEA